MHRWLQRRNILELMILRESAVYIPFPRVLIAFSKDTFLVAYGVSNETASTSSETLYFNIGSYSDETKQLSFSDRIKYEEPGEYNVFEFTKYFYFLFYDC